MNNSTIEIRRGKIEDCDGVLALIKELATYEKAPNEVTLTLEQLQLDGFGAKPKYQLFVADYQGDIVGIALYYFKYSTWKGECLYLEDLVVKEAWRRQKIGKALFEAVANEAKRLQVPRFEWQVLEWNAPAIAFYEKYEAHLDTEWINCKLTGDQLQRL